MNFHPSSFNLLLSEGEPYAHAGDGTLCYSGASNARSDVNLFHFPLTYGSIEELSSDSEVEIIEAIGMQINVNRFSFLFLVFLVWELSKYPVLKQISMMSCKSFCF